MLSFDEARLQLPIPILPGYGRWEEMYWRAWELAWQHLRQPTAESGLVAPYLNASRHADRLFMWDAAFMVQFGIYGRHAFDFMGTLDNIYAKQHEDGFISREINSQTGEDLHLPFDPNGTGPNLLAWAEWRHYRVAGDVERVERVFPHLLKLYRWFRAHRTWRDGLYWATGESSGMTNQERIPNGHLHHQHWVWVDASLQAVVNCLALQQMALALGQQKAAEELAADRAHLTRTINGLLWNEPAKFYQDLSPRGEFSGIKSIASYWALLDKELVPPARLEPFLRHLREPSAFRRPHPIPTLSADSTGYDAETGGNWRGGVWPAMNFMLLKGLRTVEQHALAFELATTHLNHVGEVFGQTNTFWENYAPETAVAGLNARPDYVGWAGLSPIAILLEDVIGVMSDWPQRRVMWDRRLQCQGHYGVQNYPLGPDYAIDLLGDDDMIFVTTEVPFTLVLRTPELSLQKAISPGTTEIPIG
ncbi:MAG: trehalase family glycosidase [Chloroflexi bacterium]|nr:trehalase family glycosidase [Chloroflexota bacterium]